MAKKNEAPLVQIPLPCFEPDDIVRDSEGGYSLCGKMTVVKKVAGVKDGRLNKFDIADESCEVLEVPYFPEGTRNAQVSASIEYTKQIRDYEPLKVSVFVSLPCHSSESEVVSTLNRAMSLASNKMSEVRQELSSKGK